MIGSKPSDVLASIIRREEERILASFPKQSERRWGLLELVRAIDNYFLYILRLDEKASGEETSCERWDLFRYGRSKAVSLFADRSCILPGPSMARSERVHQQWGRFGHCELWSAGHL